MMFRWMKSSTWISTSSRPQCPFRLKMSGHFGFLHVMHHLVEMTLESLFQAVFGVHLYCVHLYCVHLYCEHLYWVHFFDVHLYCVHLYCVHLYCV